MTDALGIALLGAGIFAKEAIYSRSEKSARDVAQIAARTLNLPTPPSVYHDRGGNSANLDALLSRKDISAVIMALPIMTQPPVIIKALAAGKHVISEKPVAPDVQTGLKLIAEYNTKYKPKGLIWRVAENYEAEPTFRAVGKAIRTGKIGQVQSFRAVVVDYIDQESMWYKTPWRTKPDYQDGFLLDGGVHTIAALRVILPRPLTHLSGFASLNKDYLAPHDTVHAIVQAGPDIHGTAALTWASPTESRPGGDEFVINDSKGWVSANDIYDPGTDTSIIRVVEEMRRRFNEKGM